MILNENKTIELVGTLTDAYDMHVLRCNVCNYTWKDRPIKVKNVKYCPECRKKYITSPYSENIKEQ